MSLDNPEETPQLKPYLVRAVWQCCTDFGLTPYLRVSVDDYTQVPPQYVQDGEITLNVSDSACVNLNIGDDEITFRARFAGKPFDIAIPMGRVFALFARENTEIGLYFHVSDKPTPQIKLDSDNTENINDNNNDNNNDNDNNPPPRPSGIKLVE